jgi:DNA mismatch repair protein MSH3
MAAGDLRCASASKETLAVIDPVAAASGDMEHLFVDEGRFSDVLEKRNELDMARNHLDSLLPNLARALNVRSVSYVNVTNQGNYLVEVPVELEKRAPKQWQRVSSTKKVLRYRPPEVKAALADLELAEEYVAVTAAAAWRRLQSEFSKTYSNLFRTAVDALAALDCLNGFASLAATGNYVCPEFVTDDEEPRLHVVGGRHPILDVLLEGSFVPNDIMLGGPKGHRCAVITGPNMGGKSCYIRQAALIACMAQAGSFVPAVSCTLHAFDAIYTRMGAADNIALGRSTFLEELGEASAILRKATRRSLVIMDELGRGTSTQDGKAIAASTLEYLLQKIGCLLLFVTHYPEIARLGLISGGGAACFHMAHVVEDRPHIAGSAVPPRVTFLYKLISGVAESSYGLNVARMAGLPEAVVQRAYEKAREVEGAGHEELACHSVARSLFALADNERSQKNVSNAQSLKDNLMALQKQIDLRMIIKK